MLCLEIIIFKQWKGFKHKDSAKIDKTRKKRPWILMPLRHINSENCIQPRVTSYQVLVWRNIFGTRHAIVYCFAHFNLFLEKTKTLVHEQVYIFRELLWRVRLVDTSVRQDPNIWTKFSMNEHFTRFSKKKLQWSDEVGLALQHFPNDLLNKLKGKHYGIRFMQWLNTAWRKER